MNYRINMVAFSTGLILCMGEIIYLDYQRDKKFKDLMAKYPTIK